MELQKNLPRIRKTMNADALVPIRGNTNGIGMNLAFPLKRRRFASTVRQSMIESIEGNHALIVVKQIA